MVACISIDQDRAADDLGVVLNACSQIDGVADASIGRPVLCAGVSCDHLTGGNANANADLELILSSLIVIEGRQQIRHFQSGAYRLFAMIIPMERGTKYRHQTVAEHLI